MGGFLLPILLYIASVQVAHNFKDFWLELQYEQLGFSYCIDWTHIESFKNILVAM